MVYGACVSSFKNPCLPFNGIRVSRHCAAVRFSNQNPFVSNRIHLFPMEEVRQIRLWKDIVRCLGTCLLYSSCFAHGFVPFQTDSWQDAMHPGAPKSAASWCKRVCPCGWVPFQVLHRKLQMSQLVVGYRNEWPGCLSLFRLCRGKE